MKLGRLIIKAITLTLEQKDIEKVENLKNSRIWFLFVLSSISMAFLIFEVVRTYIRFETWIHITLIILYSFTYSVTIVISLILINILLFIRRGIKKNILTGLLTTLPVILVAFVDIVLKLQFNHFRVIAYFPENSIFIMAYILVLSNVKLASEESKLKGFLVLIFTSIILYWGLGFGLSKIFKI